MSSSSLTNKPTTNKKSSWRWWQHNSSDHNNKSPESDNNDDQVLEEEDTVGKQDCSLSIAQSSLLVHRSIHSKESEDINSTTSIISKPWVSQPHQPCSSSVTKFDEEESVLQSIDKAESDVSIAKNLDNNNNNNSNAAVVTPASSSLMNVPSMTSSTVPVINFKPEQDQRHRRKSSDTPLFSGFKVNFL
jgi:hypothetical protein